MAVFTHSDTHFTPSNALKMHVYNHERAKSFRLGAFYPFRKKLKEKLGSGNISFNIVSLQTLSIYSSIIISHRGIKSVFLTIKRN